MDLSDYGTHNAFEWSNKHLIKLLTGSKNPILDDPVLINAFRAIDRGDFLPEDYKELAYHDRLINVGQGQVSTNPTLVAKKLSYLKPFYGGRYLHLGTGTGYLSTLLAFIAGDTGAVYSLERIQLIWNLAREFASSYLKKYNLNLNILYRDGQEGLKEEAPYDGIVFSYVPDSFPEDLLSQLHIGGRILYPNALHQLHVIDKIGVDDYIDEQIPGFNAYAFGKQQAGVR